MPNWRHVLGEIQKETSDVNDSADDKVRRKYLMELNRHHGRNVICYYSGFLSKPSTLQGLEINDEDKNGFMLCVHGLDRSKGLDLFLHTPGGNGAATESLIDYLKQIFGNDIRAFVPQIAMSAGTIMACACKEIFMGKHSNLGPIDPQINGLPAAAVIAEIQTAYDDITKNNQRAWVWNPILSRYTPGFVQQCHWAMQAAQAVVTPYLKDNMFSGRADAQQLADRIVARLTDLSTNKGHDKHIHAKECQDLGLEIRLLEDKSNKQLQDLVLTVHHCYMFSLSNTGAFKFIENHTGRRWIKAQVQQQIVFQPGGPVIAPPAAPAAPKSVN
jgi:ATP-dependent protease ClpP protease subunit